VYTFFWATLYLYNLYNITFRLTNVIPERIIFVSRGITVVMYLKVIYLFQHKYLRKRKFKSYEFRAFCNWLQFEIS